MADDGPSLTGALLEQRYRVDTLLARGGMSSVYRGLDTRLDRPVAIKVMDPRFADDQSFVERFVREARSAAKIDHPNVVAVHDQGVDGDQVYLVMELVNGGTLRDLLRGRGALGVPLALSIMEPLLAALAAAHRAGLVHRDVKPENVLIGTGGVVKVGDFGLVRAAASAGTTSSKVILGTAAYLSPEQVTTGAATSRGDVYSAGVVLYEMLTGSVPYTGDTALSVAYRHVNDDIPAPGTVAPQANVPPALDDLVSRATRREPGIRPADAGAFLLELRRVRAGTAVPWVPVPVPTRDLASGPAPEPVDAPGQAAQKLAVLGSEEDTQTPLPPVNASAATVVRRAPAGFQAMGPQGTRAMLRSDLTPPPSGAIPLPPHQAPPSPPWGMPPPAHLPMTTPGPGPARRSPRARLVVWSIVGILTLALLGAGTWWFAAGRWTTVPPVDGLAAAQAEKLLADADLAVTISRIRDNDVTSGVVIRTDPASGGRALRGDQITVFVSMGKPRVPDVTPGTSLDAAQQAIMNEQLVPRRDDSRNEFHDTVAKGQVIKLDPPAGTQLDIGQSVLIVVSDGPRPKPVPDVRGKTRDEAFQVLLGAGFEPFDAEQEFAGDMDGGRVIRTNPPASTQIGNGQTMRVGVVVSNAVTVPDLSGQLISDASNALQALGLAPQIQQIGPASPTNRVFHQSPGAGTRVQKGSAVALVAFG